MAILASVGFCVALTERGGLWVVGQNDMGQLGTGAENMHPVELAPFTLLGGVGHVGGDDIEVLVGGVEALALVGGAEALALLGAAEAPAPGAPHPFANESVVMVAAGLNHTVCVTDSGVVWAWGINFRGALGHGDLLDRPAPVRWAAGACGGAPVAMVACGRRITLALTRDGAVWQSGHMTFADEGSVLPAQVAGLPPAVMVSAGSSHNIALDADGHVWTWGASTMGALGTVPAAVEDDGFVEFQFPPRSLTPADFGGETVVFVAAGVQNSAAVTHQGVLWVWGLFRDGRGTPEPSVIHAAPTLLQGAGVQAWDGLPVMTVSLGDKYALALTADMGVWSWGRDIHGRLGHADIMDRWVPTRIPRAAFGGSDVVLACAGGASLDWDVSMAVSAEGILYTWGPGTIGHHGVDAEPSTAPFPVAETLAPGGRVGRSARLPRQFALALCMGTDARLGVDAAHRDVNAEMLREVAELCAALDGAYAHMHEGQLRLLGVRERIA